jgi:hypothetical protein
MKTHVSARCQHPDCKETAHWTFDTRREAANHYPERQRWKCLRHDTPELVLSPNCHDRVMEYTCTVKGDYRYWHDGVRLGSGFAHGPGFRAYADDFPEGTVLTVRSHVELPKPI